MRQFSVREITKIAVFLGLLVMLELLESSFFRMAQGGSVSFASLFFLFMIPFLSKRDGVALFCLWRLLTIIVVPPFIASPVQFLLDYIVAYGGFMVALFIVNFNKYETVMLAIMMANIWRYLVHVLTGILYFGQYAQGPVVGYSLSYNLTYMLPTVIIHIILALSMKKSLEKIQRVYE